MLPLPQVEFKALPSSRTVASPAAGSDIRTATTLILFEEFVPLEYRQQLAGNTSSRKRLPSLFSSTKGKQWKPASTLNGRPYVVGHVPHIPSYREVEFEGLLRAKSDTKVISLGTAVRSSGISGMTMMNSPVLTISPEKVRPRTAPPAELFTLPVAPAPAPAPVAASATAAASTHALTTTESGSTAHQVESAMATATTTTTPSAKRLSRFKLPVVIPVTKTGMTPAEYSTVEFETRVASYSDDEYSHERSSKAVRRGADDDESWMEILVATQDRGMSGQEAEFTRKGKGKAAAAAATGTGSGTGPEEASLEVARALAGVLDGKGSDEEEEEEREGGAGSFVDEVQLIPRRMDAYDGDYFSQPERRPTTYEHGSETHESTGEGDEEHGREEEEMSGLSYRQQQKAQRRLGYFDLHPERRHAIRDVDQEDDDDEDEDEDGADGFNPLVDSYVAPLVPRKIGTASSPPSSADGHSRGHGYDEMVEDRFGKRPIRLESIIAAANANANLGSNGTTIEGKGKGKAIALPTTPVSVPAPAGKTAALIEMYRERERGTSPIASVVTTTATTTTKPTAPIIAPPSRLPVRALPTPPKEGSPAPHLTLPIAAPAAVLPGIKTQPIIPPIRTTTTPEAELEPPPVVAAMDENGRASPARYVHGAPLHNVMEEEEE